MPTNSVAILSVPVDIGSRVSTEERMKERLTKLRKAMRDQKISAFLVPHTDEHQSEYTPSYAERLNWVSGFDGSAGFACITLNKNAVSAVLDK